MVKERFSLNSQGFSADEGGQSGNEQIDRLYYGITDFYKTIFPDCKAARGELDWEALRRSNDPTENTWEIRSGRPVEKSRKNIGADLLIVVGGVARMVGARKRRQ